MPLFWCRRNLMAFQTSPSFSRCQNINFMLVEIHRDFQICFRLEHESWRFTDVFLGLMWQREWKSNINHTNSVFHRIFSASKTFSSSNSAAKHSLISDLFLVPFFLPSKTMKATYLWSLLARGIRCVVGFYKVLSQFDSSHLRLFNFCHVFPLFGTRWSSVRWSR
jgi:hypothetical protein